MPSPREVLVDFALFALILECPGIQSAALPAVMEDQVNSSSLTYIAPVFRVTDLARALAFYRDQLGFQPEFCYEDFYASVCRDGCHLHLQCAPPTPRDQAVFERDEHIDACVVVRRAEELSADLASKGGTFVVPLRQMPYGSEFYVRDPDGYILGFIEPAQAPE